ncbi:hypothetical protein [Bacteroides sp. FSHCM14E1]|uniref:hypothetical protein n=1 Tax=Bacteroides sp. FSHCM14E1 TaxID=2784518 RepID=UPI001C72C7BD|nr:hypothetical protein [Bacteroides sp. FSHCM14E1]
MGNNNKTISKEAFEALKKQLIKTSEIDLNINKGYNALADYINEKARENYPAPTNENGKVIQYKEHISPDTIRRYWGKKSSNKINNPEEQMKPNLGKLTLMAQALKCKDIYEFCEKNGYETSGDFESTPDTIKNAFNTIDYFNFSSLLIGEVIFIGWYGRKFCRLKKIQEKDFEDDSFEVIESYGTKSSIGRKFSTSGFELAPVSDNTNFPEIIIIPRYEYQTELWEYYDNIKKSGKFDTKTCPLELLL